jgi:hypothetical protein
MIDPNRIALALPSPTRVEEMQNPALQLPPDTRKAFSMDAGPTSSPVSKKDALSDRKIALSSHFPSTPATGVHGVVAWAS